MKVRTTESVLEVLRTHKLDLRDRFSVLELGLFGSYATGTQTSESDVDILYVLEEGISFGLLDIDAFEKHMKALLEVNELDLVDRRYLNPLIELDIQETLIYV